MKVINSDKNCYILRFDLDEEVITMLSEFCSKLKIKSAFFNGIGACKEALISYYDLENKKYLDKTIQEEMEIVSLIGNVGTLDLKTAIHAHGLLADKEYQTYGGHFKSIIISATCEIHLTILAGEMKRSKDLRTGLNLLG